jgi:nucleotide sugar dehydrogenase
LEVSAGGHRLRCTPDHPFVVGDLRIKLASELDPQTDRLPLASNVDFFVHESSEGRRSCTKNEISWVAVDGVREVDGDGVVYSLEVPDAGTVVTTGGLVAHNCFPKDSRALVRIGEEASYDFALLRGVIDVNEEQYERVVEKIQRLGGGSLDGIKVAVWGLTFKARTDDLRESPSLAVIRRLTARGATVVGFDPTVARDLGIDGLEIVTDPYAACEHADVLAVLTEWDEFRWHDFDKVKEVMTRPAVVDGRNLLDPAPLKRRGFVYEGIGRA